MERKRLNVLVLGGTGMAGHTVSLYLKEQGHHVTVFSRRKVEYCKSICGDIMDHELVIKVLTENNFDIVINCIGLLNRDCDKFPDKAVYLNSYLPHFLANFLKDTPTRLFHMSTDCVFSGSLGSYNENSFRDGASFYDRTKALGEVDDNKNLTFRNSIIGPDNNSKGIGLFNWFMKQSGEIEGYNQAIWTGVTTLTLAKAMERAATENLTGIYNLVNNETITKFEMLLLFNKHFNKEDIKIIKNSKIKVDKSLINNRKDFSFIVPTYEQMVIEMKDWIFNHKEYYPHYFN